VPNIPADEQKAAAGGNGSHCGFCWSPGKGEFPYRDRGHFSACDICQAVANRAFALVAACFMVALPTDLAGLAALTANAADLDIDAWGWKLRTGTAPARADSATRSSSWKRVGSELRISRFNRG